MDFAELESMEGLRFPWNSWPPSKPDANDLVIPLSALYTPLLPLADLPLLSYDPLACSACRSVLNPYARVNYPVAQWICPFCHLANHFPKSYAAIADHNLPAELFPTYSTVEYLLPASSTPTSNSNSSSSGSNNKGGINPGSNCSFVSASSAVTNSSSMSSGSSGGSLVSGGRAAAEGPGFVFVVDACTGEEELRVLKGEILRVVAGLPENALVGLVSFGEMVWVHDLGFNDCSRVLVFAGDRELTSHKIMELMGISHPLNGKLTVLQPIHRRGYLLPVSECEFNITSALEELISSPRSLPGHRPKRASGVAISVSVAVLEGCLPYPGGGRIMIFTSGPATVGPGMIVETDLSHPIRTHRDIINGQARLSQMAEQFYRKLAQRLLDHSIVLDLFAGSLDQVGAAELRFPVETSGGYMVLAESFESNQFKKCLRHMFKHEGTDHLHMNFDASISIVSSKEVKICGALGPCMSLRIKNNFVSDKEVGHSGTNVWKLSTLTNKTCLAFVFQLENSRNADPGPVFFIQFMTRYRHGNGAYRLRVTTAARRWAPPRSPDISSGFDQEAAAAIMARLAVYRAEQYYAREVIRWLDKMLIRFTAKFGAYMPENPSSFRLSSGFSLYPQFMYYLRRSQFIDVFNSSPDETAFCRLALNREGVVSSLVMIQPTLFQYSFDGPPIPVLLDISSVSSDVILLFDSFFHVVIHYGSNIAQWRKMGYEHDPSYESLRKLVEAPEIDAEALVEDRIPVPKLIKCDQHGSQARFLLARLNPSSTQKSRSVEGSEVVFTDDVSLQDFLEHLQELAVQG